MTSDVSALISRATAWQNEDPDPLTRDQLGSLIAATQTGDTVAQADLEERFSGHLTFGTAGLRGELGAGPMRMNRVVVSHAARGLGQFLLSRGAEHNDLSVVIAYDARINSDVFARDTANILAGMGIRALLIGRYAPTPVLAFAVKHLDATAGVMVTASHNPPADNGYKVYLGGVDGGSQIIPPADGAIHRQILDSHQSTSLRDIPTDDNAVTVLGAEIIQAYITETARLIPDGDPADKTALRVCYTPLHGVGGAVFLALLDDTGFAPPVVVPEQAAPDPAFSTVAFPNPEEPGALDLAYRTATEHSCDLIVAHDPDGDRLAIALPDADTESGWAMLTGNDLGVLLLADVAEHAARDGHQGTLACSLVSTPMISRLASQNGHHFVSTPTGFKWISRPQDLLAGFEEALGYLINPGTVRDKDGISAGLALMNLAHRLRDEGSNLSDRLGTIAAEYGGWASDTIGVRLGSVDEVVTLMNAIRQSPESLIGPTPNALTTDYLTDPPKDFPASDLVTVDYVDGGRVIIRPSGTEPKLKIYVDALADDHPSAVHIVKRLASGCRAGLDALIGDGKGV